MRKFLVFAIFVFYEISFAECSIEEVVDFSDEGMSLEKIRTKCDNTIIDSDCSISKVVNLSRNNKGLFYIKENCSSSDSQSERRFNSHNNQKLYQYLENNPATICLTPYGSCPMMIEKPIGVPCTCYSSMGPPINGITR